MPPRAPYRFALRAAAAALSLGALLLLFDLASPRLPLFLTVDLPNGPRDLAALRDADGGLLYLGDSVVTAVDAREPERATLHQMVAEELARPIALASHPANAIDSHLAQVRYLQEAGVEPRLTILPINLRGFSPPWEHNPRYNFALRNRMYTRPLTARLWAVFKHRYGEPSRGRPGTFGVYLDGRDLGAPSAFLPTGRAQTAEELRKLYLLRYATDLERSPRFRELQALLARLRRRPLPLLVYATPINWQGMRRAVEPADLALVRRKIRRLERLFAAEGVELLDLTRLLPADRFDHPPRNPHEHLNGAGRRATAAAIAERARAMLDRL